MQIHSRGAALSILVLCSASAWATDQVAEANADPVAEVEVSALRNPELKPYRIMSAGLDAFDEHHKLAPNAALKFRISKRSDLPTRFSHWDKLSLRLAGDNVSIPVPIAGDGSFILPRSKEAYDDDAELILNQKKSSVLFWVEARTPGVPANMLRLGDLRLECQVLLGMGKKELNFAMRAMFTAAFRTADWCSAPRAAISTPLHDWAMNATLVSGGTRKSLGPSSTSFNAPVQDKTLPDDALIEFDYWGAASDERKQQFLAQYPLQLKTSMNKWGAGVPFVAGGKGLYTAVVALKPGSWKFNLESQGREVNLGAAAKGEHAQFGPEQALLWHGYQLNYKIEQAGNYAFALNLIDPDHPTVTVTRASAAASEPGG